MLNRKVVLILQAFIMNVALAATAACTYETVESQPTDEDTMGLPAITKANLQQRSKTGQLTPGSTGKIGFQLPEFLTPDGKPDPGNYTLQFGVDDPNTSATVDGYVLTRAEIIWKVSGNDVRRVVDCANGVSVTGAAEGVSVSVFDETNGPRANSRPYVVSLQVVKGTRPSIQQPPVYSTAEAVLAGAGAFVDINIPANIGAVSVSVVVAPVNVGVAIGAYDIEVIQFAPTLTGRKRYDPRQDQWVPLVGGASLIEIQTSVACPPFRYQVSFGVDG
jgi:hypothetical protein